MHEPMCYGLIHRAFHCLPRFPNWGKMEFLIHFHRCPAILFHFAQVFREKLINLGDDTVRISFIFLQPVVKTVHQLLVKLLFESRFRRVIEISSSNTTESIFLFLLFSFFFALSCSLFLRTKTEIPVLTCENTERVSRLQSSLLLYLMLNKSKRKKHRTRRS